MKYGIFELMLAAVVISFVGFAIENTWLLLTKGYMDNRNMTLPFLLGYGILMVDFYLMFGTPSDVHLPIVSDRFTDREIYFVLAFFTVSIGEIMLGTATEKATGVIYWDYSWIPMHLTRYTSLPTSLGFAYIIENFMTYCFPEIMGAITLLPAEIIPPAAVILFTALSIDTLHGFWKMYSCHSLYCLWKIKRPKLDLRALI